MDFGNKIKAICKEEGINLRKFSELTNISYESISNYSRGKRTPSWEQINTIANTPRFEKYKQFLLSPDSDQVDAGQQLDKDTLEAEEAEILQAYRLAKMKEAKDALKFVELAKEFYQKNKD